MPKISTIEQYAIDMAIKVRKENQLSQRQLAKILGVAPSFVGSVENPDAIAKYNLRHIHILSAYFKISPKDFVPLKPDPSDV